MLSYKLEKFEGPLDLLLHLIEKNKVSIYDIPIFEITNQYMEYVNAMEEEDLDIVSEFLVMTATLLDIKSRLLLPAEKDENGDEIDPREELVTRLVEYKTSKSLGEQLKSRQLLASRLLYKDPTIPDEVSKYEPPVNVQDMLSRVTLERLQEIYRMVTRRQVDKIDPVRSKFGNIEKDPVRLSQKLALVYEYAQQKKHFSFRGLLQKQYTKADVVVTFLACLELIKIGRLTVKQEGTFRDIHLDWNEECTTTITREDMEQYD